jgi:enoyl-CoA hydratase/carnithine racemase
MKQRLRAHTLRSPSRQLGMAQAADAPPFNRIDHRFAESLRQAIHEASQSDIRVLVFKAEGPNFSFGSDVREWQGKDSNWFRTFIADVNSSYRAIEALRIPTVAAVQGVAFSGGFELALSCDFIVAADNAVFRCAEVGAGMVPLAGALQRLAERVGRARASRLVMLGESISGSLAGQLGIATEVVPEAELAQATDALIKKLAVGPTKSFAATKTLLKAWSPGGVPAADAMMIDVTIDLFSTEDSKRGLLSKAEAFDRGIEPPDMVFNGR